MRLILIIGVVIVLIAGGIGAFWASRNSDNVSETAQTGTINSEQDEKIEISDKATIDSNLAIGGASTENSVSGNYITGMEAEAFKNSNADKIVLFFYANWCPLCKPVDEELKENIQRIPAGVEVYRVNYNDDETDNDEKDLAAKYGVTYQHTFVQVDKNGVEITKWNGGGLDKLLSSIK